MNTLEAHILNHKLDATQVMNQLQDQAIISDNCVYPCDVEEQDAINAVKWLEQQ